MKQITKRPRVDKKHQRHIANVDFYNGIVKQQIDDKRVQIEAELEATDYIDIYQQKAALDVFDEFMDDTLRDLDFKRSSQKKIVRRFEKAKRIFETKVMRQIHRIGMSIEESKLSATFGGATEDGHVMTHEWRDNVRKMLSGDNVKFSSKTYFDEVLGYIGYGLYFFAFVMFISILLASIIAGELAASILIAWGIFAIGQMLRIPTTFFHHIRFGKYVDRYINKLNDTYLTETFERERKERDAEFERRMDEIRNGTKRLFEKNEEEFGTLEEISETQDSSNN